jgi:peptide/nickel transport system permease protein
MMTDAAPRRTRRIAIALLALVVVMTTAAPWLAPHGPTEQHTDRQYAPPTHIRLRHEGEWRAPFIYRQVLEDRIVRQYREDRTTPIALAWFTRGRLVSTPSGESPLLVLGADAAGRDIFSRLLIGAHRSLGVTLFGALGAVILGALVGAVAGTVGGRTERWLMLAADFILVLPAAYLVLVLRGLLPAVLSPPEIFLLLSVFFALAAWPHVARGVRAIVAAERTREYAEASRAAGAGSWRQLRHLLPAARGFLAVEIVLLVPALLLAEATLSYLNFGFLDPTPSWGTMLQDAANVNLLGQAPWILAPAVALFMVSLAVQLAVVGRAPQALLLGGRRDRRRFVDSAAGTG